ncbi:Glucosamine-phosphate N-acetyltransferase-like protein [Gaertneriomyces sp. JEL0708]|nr:Glucosamine-phosphate N-acetyltransferase-like protein [Gaertneriomyces sp. JEL0708]
MADALFDPALISPDLQSQLKPQFLIRPLAPTDYHKQFLPLLSQLTTVGDLTHAQFLDRYSYLKTHSHEYYTIVIEDTSKQLIVGAGTILVERKFVHLNGLVGHIEDIVTHKEYRGMNLGKMVIETLKHIGKVTGCYKIILDCSKDNIPFYEKCGFKHKEYEMVTYIDENDASKVRSKL